jgi:deoxyribodipyrimidine photo-lyase
VNAEHFGAVAGQLLDLARRHHCDALYFNREYEIHELRRDQAVTVAFEHSGRSVFALHDQAVLAPGLVTKADGSAYTVFTPFRNRWWSAFERTGGVETLPAPKAQPQLVVEPEPVPSGVAGFERRTRADLWPAGEGPAQARLRRFLERRAGAYRHRRDTPAENGTSTLSPYLASGVLSARACLLAALQARHDCAGEDCYGIDAWVQQIIWRDFYRHVLVAFPRVSMNQPFQTAAEALIWEDDEPALAAWREGRTGVPIVDAGMRQLQQTGWMHNRTRMIVAMFLSKHLMIDWRRGEQHFMRHLVDGDLANNNGGWQWSASTGTDAVPYFRLFNPYTQSRRFDPSGAYIRRFVPELAKLSDEAIHEPYAARTASQRLDYPPPIVEHRYARQRALARYAAVRTS